MPSVDQEETIFTIPADVLQRLQDDVRNVQSSVEIQYLYNKLKRMGPWSPEELNIELIMDIDSLHSAIVVAYGRIFTDGPRRVSKSKIPSDLRHIHHELYELRNKRYAHNDEHASIATHLDIDFDGEKVLLKTGYTLNMTLGAPASWEPLFEWLNQYLKTQIDKQLAALTVITGYKWEQPSGPPPSWVDYSEHS